MSPAVWVPLLVVSILLLQAAIWIPLVALSRKRRRERFAQLRAEIEQSGETVISGPLTARLRRGHVTFLSVAVLTNRRILVIDRARTELPLDALRDVRIDEWFNGSFRGGREWLIVTLEGREIGLSLPAGDAHVWSAAIAKR
jgi:hypothetical protein